LNQHLHKTLLALTISACASQAFAQNYDVSLGSTSQTDQTLTGDFTLSGQASRTIAAQQTDVLFQRTVLNGSFIDNAHVTLDAGSNFITGLGIDPTPLSSQAPDVAGTITGDVRLNGSIALINTDDAEAVEIGKVTIAGSLINAGTISVTQSPTSQYGGAEGLYLHGTQIGGDLINSGTINVQTAYGIGMIIDQPSTLPFTLGGQLINSGSIIAIGDHAWGIDIEAPTSALNIVNSGTIHATGASAQAITLEDGTYNALKNSGQIIADGDSTARAIVIEGANFTSTNPTGQRGIVNTGTISATGDAIVATGSDPLNSFEINQQAGLIASQTGAAIRGGNFATLNWSGGEIDGDILDLQAVNILGQAKFQGANIGSNVVVSNGGSLNLAAAGTTISGNLDVASQSGVDMHLSNATVNTSPYLTVGGTATFASGSHITLSATPGDFTPTAAGKTYSLVSAASVQNNGLTVSSASSLLDVSSYAVTANSIAAVVTLKSDAQVGEALGSVGASQTTQGIVNRFKNDVLGNLNANDKVYQSFANAGSSQALAKLGKQLAPEVSRGSVDAAMAGAGLTSNALNTRMNGQRSGLSSGEALADSGVWVQTLDSNMDQDSRGGVAGYSANASGITLGADGKINPNTTLGLAYSYVNANVSSDTGNKTDVHGNSLALYGAWELGNWFSQGSLSYGHDSNDSKRYVADTLAKGSYDSDVLSLNALAGYSFKVNDRLLLEPRVAARYSNVQVDGYSEHNSSAALHNGDQRFETGELGAGLRVASNAALFGGMLQPEATLMAYHDLIGDRINQTSAFTQGGSSFTVTGAKAARDSYEGSLGVNYAINALTFGASYNYQAKSGYNADTVMLKARYNF
jgi:outer membrane autotransporter protein